jgi:hypothetical protein
MPAPTTNPGHNDQPATHPTAAFAGDPSAEADREAWLRSYCARMPGAVAARLSFRWFIEDEGFSTMALRAEGRRRLKRLGDRHGFMPVWDAWTIRPDGWLEVAAWVAWWPVGEASLGERVDLVDEAPGPDAWSS